MRVYKYNGDRIKIKVSLNLEDKDYLPKDKESRFDYLDEPFQLYRAKTGHVYPSLWCYLAIDIQYIISKYNERNIR